MPLFEDESNFEQEPGSLDDYNREGLRVLHETQSVLTEKMIDTAFLAIKLLWKEQDEEFDRLGAEGWPEGEELKYKVMEDPHGFPFEEDHTTRALSMLLRPKVSESVDPVDINPNDATLEKLKVFVPIPQDTALSENFLVDELPKPKEIGIAYTTPEGLVCSYVINKLKVLPFVSAFDGDDVEIAPLEETPDIVMDELSGDPAVMRVEAPLVADLFTKLLQWKAVVQRVSAVGDPEVHDL